MKERMRQMEERVANVEGAIKLLTDMLNRQDFILTGQDDKIKKYDEIITRLDNRGEEQKEMLKNQQEQINRLDKIITGQEVNNIVFNKLLEEIKTILISHEERISDLEV